MIGTNRCQDCGKPFESELKSKKYCPNCRDENGYRIEKKAPRVCEICGRNIDSKPKTAKICGSPECKAAKTAEYQNKYLRARKASKESLIRSRAKYLADEEEKRQTVLAKEVEIVNVEHEEVVEKDIVIDDDAISEDILQATEKSEEDNNINHPSHYLIGGIEVIDYIKSKLTVEEFRGYLKGNIIKYTSRAGYKGNPIEDYKKASWYIDRLVAEMEAIG